MKTLGWLVVAMGTMIGTARAAECEWKPPKNPPAFKVERFRGAELTFRADARWFSCARKAGGELSSVFTVSDEKGQTHTLPPEPIKSYSARATLGLKKVCEQGPGLKTVQASLLGKGELSRLDFTSQPETLYCERCEFRGFDNMLVIHTSGHINPKGMLTVQGKVDERWHQCARKDSKLELWMYSAPTRLEASKLKEPTHKVTGLEAKPSFKKDFPKAPICKGGGVRWLSYELHGTGEMQRLNGGGRGMVQVRCDG